MIYPRLMIAGVQSGAGKTTVALGLMAALRDSGWRVQPFKVGPDYIDPGWHRVAAGRPSHNLDSWMGPDGAVQTIFQKNAAGMDVSIIEGVMGLYDGARNSGIKGSSAHVAMILKTPVVLVVNVRGMAQSCLAVVKGFKDYQPEMDLPGVILNQAGLYHKTVLTKALEEELGVRVLGCLPDRTDI
jgi:cobyrinic acid a,c-diamide synthase